MFICLMSFYLFNTANLAPFESSALGHRQMDYDVVMSLTPCFTVLAACAAFFLAS